MNAHGLYNLQHTNPITLMVHELYDFDMWIKIAHDAWITKDDRLCASSYRSCNSTTCVLHYWSWIHHDDRVLQSMMYQSYPSMELQSDRHSTIALYDHDLTSLYPLIARSASANHWWTNRSLYQWHTWSHAIIMYRSSNSRWIGIATHD